MHVRLIRGADRAFPVIRKIGRQRARLYVQAGIAVFNNILVHSADVTEILRYTCIPLRDGVFSSRDLGF